MERKLIYTRLPDEDDGGYLRHPGCLITDNMAFAILDDQLEIHIITPTNDPDEYDIVRASNPLFYVGDDEATVFEDVQRLLIEGVNLPAKNIFMRGPKKGKGIPMGEIDFWNLAGRAGRSGKEFQGNVICIDPRDGDVWQEAPPTVRGQYLIKKRVDEIIQNESDDLLDFISEGTPRNKANSRQDLEYAFGYFFSEHLRSGSLLDSSLSNRYDLEIIKELAAMSDDVADLVDIPAEIIFKNPGISPIAQQNLMDYFRGYKGDVEELIPVLPESNEAVECYTNIINVISDHLSGDPLSLSFPHALLVVNWMRGYPLSRIIDRNWKFWKSRKEKSKSLATVIRDTMHDVEEYARFKFAKYSSCYVDLLRCFFETTGQSDLSNRIPRLNIWLEFGASQDTQISFMSLGLSRTSAIALSSFVIDESMSPEECLRWLKKKNLQSLNLSIIIIDEVSRVIDKFTRLSR